MNRRSILAALLLGAAVLVPGPSTAAPLSCADLATLTLPDTIAISSQLVRAGTFTPPAPNPPIMNLPAFCRVSLTIAPQITVEVWLPASTWNHRFQAVGGGGYAGVISWAALATALRAGYATASTDTGHSVTTTPGGSFALNPDGTLNDGLITDFASRSLHEMTVKAKTLLEGFYGAPPAYSYWNGCSTGGRQGLMEAQRFPDDYDGILAGAPAINWDRFIPAELWPQLSMQLHVGAPIAACKFTTVTSAAVAACDGLDGVVDGILEDPRICEFDPVVLQCRPGTTPDCNCLTPGEVAATREIWDGPREPKGKRLWFGLEPGASFAGLAGAVPFSITTDHFRYWIHQDPGFDWHTLDVASFASDFKKSQKLFNDVIGTDGDNLKPFSKSGGKVLIWHGWADQLIPPMGSIDYYERVVERNGGLKRVPDFARLFMAPGVAHCGGGAGPNTFDLLGALVNWVENGQAPDRIIASRVEGGAVVRTRPLCPFPSVATYAGHGSTDDANNFFCASRPLDDGHERPLN